MTKCIVNIPYRESLKERNMFSLEPWGGGIALLKYLKGCLMTWESKDLLSVVLRAGPDSLVLSTRRVIYS